MLKYDNQKEKNKYVSMIKKEYLLIYQHTFLWDERIYFDRRSIYRWTSPYWKIAHPLRTSDHDHSQFIWQYTKHSYFCQSKLRSNQCTIYLLAASCFNLVWTVACSFLSISLDIQFGFFFSNKWSLQSSSFHILQFFKCLSLDDGFGYFWSISNQ